MFCFWLIKESKIMPFEEIKLTVNPLLLKLRNKHQRH